MMYFDNANRNAVLGAQVASPKTHATIQLIEMAVEKSDLERAADAKNHIFQHFLGNMTIAGCGAHEWFTVHEFFMRNNGTWATIHEMSEASHDIMMGNAISSDVSAMDVDS